MGISKDAIATPGTQDTHHEMVDIPVNHSETIAEAPAPSTTFSAPEEPFEGQGISNANGSNEGKSELEAHVGYQAGILSSAFSIAQVRHTL